MRLADVVVSNFRSIRELRCSFGRLAILLGPNNHGKSNLLAAVEFLLSPGMKLSPEDFFSARPDGDDKLVVEATFRELTNQEGNTFAKYVRADGSLRIQRWATLDGAGQIETGYRGYIEQPRPWWLQESALDRLRNRDVVTEAVADVPELQILLEGAGRITKERVIQFQAAYITANRHALEFEEVLDDNPLLGVKNIAGGILPDYYLIPAVRDLVDETKTTGSSAFGRLLQRAVLDMTARDPRFLAIQDRLSQLVEELNRRPVDPDREPSSELTKLERTLRSELASWGVDVTIRVVPPEVRKLLELGTELRIDDGHEAPAERKGHGLQRAVIFSLIKAWSSVLRTPAPEGVARARAASESLIFGYEEPELFLHPHAQRLLAEALKSIAETPDHQVLVCTHSTHFVDLENYRSIIVVHKPSPTIGTTVRQCTSDLFEGEENRDRKNRFHMGSWMNPDRGELFFARKVVLVEGETEKVVLPFVAQRLGCYDRTVSVIDCGSKYNLPLYITILNAFSMSYVVIHDEDPVPDPPPACWTTDRLREKTRTFALNAEIAARVSAALGTVKILCPDFEGFARIPVSQGKRKGKALAALDHFDALAPQDIPLEVADLVRDAFIGVTP